ncbi:MAG: peptidase [Candidatus Nitrosopumilus sp. bin_68KS]
MAPFFIILFSAVLILGMIPFADAHTAKVVGDFKIDIGWEVEPPIQGVDNSIVIAVSIADESDKLLYDMIFFNKIDNSNDETTELHLLGLADTLEPYVKVGSLKTLLQLEENDIVGVYSAKYTPAEIGTPAIHLSGVIKNLEFELTSKIEKIEASDVNAIPDWVKNNAKWWSEGTISDDDFATGIEHMIKNKIIDVPFTETNNFSAEQKIPDWVKNNAKWWADEMIPDEEFVRGLQFLVKNGIIRV